MGAAFRSGWGERASRRRQAHAQGPAACGVGDGRRRRWRCIHAPKPRAKGGGSAASQCRWLGVDAYLPHEQGADRLRFVPLGTVVQIDGDRPTSRGLPPAAFGGMGRRRFGRVGGALGNAGNAKFGGSAVFVCFAVWALRSLEFGRSKFGTWELKWIWGRAPADLAIWKLENWALGGQALGGLATWRLGDFGDLGAWALAALRAWGATLLAPPFSRLATASPTRRPTDVFVAQYIP